VRKDIIGCVSGGALTSDDGYPIRVTDRRTQDAVDLRRYNGKKIRVRGNLLPGDMFFLDGSPRVLGSCPGADRR
jgi:hypothetical protein